MSLAKLDLRVMDATRQNVEWMIRRHYLKKWPGVVLGIMLLTSRHNPVGVMVFAMPPRETAKRYGGITWELARLWVSDEMPRNTESWFIAEAMRRIKAKKTVEFVVSYADPSRGHVGVIYKAANFIADGRTDDKRKTARFDYAAPSNDLLPGDKRFQRRAHVPADTAISRIPRISKFRYVMPIGRKARKALQEATPCQPKP